LVGTAGALVRDIAATKTLLPKYGQSFCDFL